MQPTLAAAEIRRNLTQYLSTTFALADEHVREALDDFLNDPQRGIFRGPYLRIRTPFRRADDGWQRHLEWAPPGFHPYLHQATAFERLSTLDGPAQPTLITTGTGSGKTESFLLPLLDHCRRERARGHDGVKAVLLYPMNALATDQAGRIDTYLSHPGLGDVSAGVYIGDIPAAQFGRVRTERAEIRRERPDILITNYKMLDLLLQRSVDVPLWEGNRLAYVVVDEFHTYDGAQGTDVAMLLRRLAASTGNSEPGRPLGSICPVATSATLGADGTSGDGDEALRNVAATVFGTEFGTGSVVGEDRLDAAEFMDRIDYALPIPDPVEVAALPDPHGDREAMGKVMEQFTGRDDLDPQQLGDVLRTHILTEAVLEILDGRVGTIDDLLERLPRVGAYAWGHAMRTARAQVAEALIRFVALLSIARDPDDPSRSFLHIEAHLWVRSIHRILREVSPDKPTFSWHGEAEPPLDGETTSSGFSRGRLPAVYCRHCGRSGWAAISPERDRTNLITDPERIYRSAISTKKSVRPLILASIAEAEQRASGQDVLVLDSAGAHVRPLTQGDVADARAGQLDGVFVLTDLEHTTEAFRAAWNDRCPACGTDQGTRFLGSGTAALTSVAVTELFTSGQLTQAGEHPKTLLFNDALQDAAHRAGFVSSRSYTFSLRLLLAAHLPEDGRPAALNDVIADAVTTAGDHRYLPCVVPPDLHELPGVDKVLAGEWDGDEQVWRLIGERLAFSAILEFGLRSRQGRTLELTRTAAAEARLDDPDGMATLARDLLVHGSHQLTTVPEPRVFRGYLRGLLERIRTRGGVTHHWLTAWMDKAGTKRFGTIWGKRPTGMPPFTRGLPSPRFVIGAPKSGSEFDSISGRGTWYQDWTARCLGLGAADATRYLGALLESLHERGILTRYTAADGSTQMYGLRPGQILVRRLDAEQAITGGMACDVCSWRQTVHPERRDDWFGCLCPRYRCTGALQPDDDRRFTEDYYRQLYLSAEPFRVTTAEHTGLLTRAQRERTEEAFREGDRYSDPNVLSCTPTLELGIDIGDLSAIVLGSVPSGPEHYVQRVGRAGRRTGNALLLTFVGRRARERYYLTEPTAMIQGEIEPPGSYLSAVEILRRQYVAHLLDLAAAGRLPGVLPLPNRASALFGETGWLASFAEVALAEGTRLVEEFLGLFAGAGDPVNAEAAAALRAFATGELKDTLNEAASTWHGRLADLHARRDAIEAAMASLLDSDPEQRDRRHQLEAERRAVALRIGDIGKGNAQGALVELGVLPNYSLIDTSTSLEATITWDTVGTDGDVAYHSEVREYARPALPALTELAPDNHYYARGYRHTVDGLDIGGPNRRAWQQWRVCPGCGYTRTTTAHRDTTPCPRCTDRRIGDSSALYNVLVPTRVEARDRRDDAVIRDDHDERQRRFYEMRTLVDIAREDVVPGAWRHRHQTFGVEFTRRAVIRRFNLGALRMDRPADTPFAGEFVRPNPFHVCLECGGATADEPDRSRAAAVTTSGYDASPNHHRPWCRHRRGDTVDHLRLVLAHTLETEALRILVPAATVRVPERITSFRAAIMAGLAELYGGRLDHIDATTATMPDPGTGMVRRFLVVYDTLPGGSGYLNPRSGEDGIREILTKAREVVANCPCQPQEGAHACHRCLLAHVNDEEYPLADRALAEEMLDDLLTAWETEPVSTTDDISLLDQVESELEARFLAALKGWVERPGAERSLSEAERINDRRVAHLRITGDDGTVVSWRVMLQRAFAHTTPDVMFQRLDARSQRVAVYLDGYAFHASPENNRVADDARKRARLRAEGITVFQLTWDDIVYWETGRASGDPVWQPYGHAGQTMARNVHQQEGGVPDELPDLVWTSPITTLLAFLAQPDLDVWRRRAAAAAVGMAKVPGAVNAAVGRDGLTTVLAEALRGAPPPPARNTGELRLVRGLDVAGMPVTLLLDGTTRAVSAFVVLDDRTETVGGDQEAYKRLWKSWLYWGNLVQFLSSEGSDGGQLVLSDVDAFDPAILIVAGGMGLSQSLARFPIADPETVELLDGVSSSAGGKEVQPEAPQASPGFTEDGRAEPTPANLSGERPQPDDPLATPEKASETAPEPDPAWDEVIDLLDPDEPGLESLARALSHFGVRAPLAGYELEGGMWPAEMAWPEARVAVVLREDPANEHEQAKRDAAYADAGWEARNAGEWKAADLAELLNRREG